MTEYFNWKQFRTFLKKLKSSKEKVIFCSTYGNSMGGWGTKSIRRFIVKSIFMELWDNYAIYHIILNKGLKNEIDLEIPADSELIKGNNIYGYWWYDGPKQKIMFYKNNISGIIKWKKDKR